MRAKLVAGAIMIGLAVAAVLFIPGLIGGLFNAKTEVRVAKGQAGAAIESGQDAIEALANSMARASESDAQTRSNEDAIRNAKGADVRVDGAVRDAGLVGLCRRAAYRGDPKCLRFTPAR